jgi:NAD(P)-dependent dehydrogenase (short-subunit alcohol dehydrogenase family)
MEGLVKGKVVLVTGGASGIGRAAAVLFAREGAKVSVSDIVVEGGEETIRLIKKSGGEAFFVRADVSKAEDVEAMVNQTVKTYRRLDCAFNNAGISESGAEMAGTVRCSEKEWERIMDINLKGVWLCMKYEIPQMVKTGGGAIVNTSSFAGITASKLGLVVYSGSKHGVVGVTKTAAVEFGKQGIRINAVCPGATRTAMLEKHMADPEEEARIASMNPLNRIASPIEIAEAVVWLCSDRASFVTGIAMPVDGGQTLY